jgi:ABC-type polysaccharide/polyol phosphate transport system ATPase subunit
MNFVIRLSNLNKTFYLTSRSQGIYALLMRSINTLLKTSKKEQTTSKYSIDALKNISLDIEVGEVVGVIGKNGSGKSTLGKVIGGLLKPTSGSLEICGNVLYLSSFGGALQKKLTGRENVYLIGILNGLSRKEIDERIPQILEFSGLGAHFDLPVQIYSKGMLTRLIFSASIHTLPKNLDILILDEVFSTGADIDFSEKALMVVTEYIAHAKTIVFISHNMNLIQKYCSRCILLEKGTVKLDATTKVVVDTYVDKKKRKNAELLSE